MRKLLFRLYPAWWRKRYGAEFEALLEDAPRSWAGTFDLLRGAIGMRLSGAAFWKLTAVLALAGSLAGFGVSFLVTPRYTSDAVLEYENSGGPAGHKIAVDRFRAVASEVLSRPGLSTVISNIGLYQRELQKLPLEEVIDTMRRDIRVNISSSVDRAAIFSIEFTYTDPAQAQRTVMAVISRFMDINVKAVGAAEGRIAVDRLSVLDPANLPLRPAYPNRLPFMIAGLGIGLLAALIIGIKFARTSPRHLESTGTFQ